MIQLLYQSLHDKVKEVQEDWDEKKQEAGRKESFDRTTILTNSDQPVPSKKEVELAPELTIADQHAFTVKLVEVLRDEPLLSKIQGLSTEIFCL